jgi:hypothetical protein
MIFPDPILTFLGTDQDPKNQQQTDRSASKAESPNFKKKSKDRKKMKAGAMNKKMANGLLGGQGAYGYGAYGYPQRYGMGYYGMHGMGGMGGMGMNMNPMMGYGYQPRPGVFNPNQYSML